MNNEILTTYDYEKILKFNNLIQNASTDNFEYYVLKLLNDIFNIKRCAFYNFSNYIMTNITVLNYTEDITNEYMQNISHNDIVCNYISENEHSFEFPFIITLKDIFKNSKYKKKFVNSLHHKFFIKNNIHYEMSLIINEQWDMISWERCLKEGEYTKKDKALATHLCNIIASSYRLVKENRILKDEVGLFHMSKENLNFGFMIFDENMNLVHFNNSAINYCFDITKTYFLDNNINAIKKLIFNEKNIKEIHNNRFITYKTIKPYVYEISKIGYMDKNNSINTYYMVNVYHECWFTNMKKLNYNIEKFNLTQREKEVISEIMKGLGNQEIADKLCISINTVKMHIKNIYKKLNVSNRCSLITKLKYLY